MSYSFRHHVFDIAANTVVHGASLCFRRQNIGEIKKMGAIYARLCKYSNGLRLEEAVPLCRH
jgi:hypothetical protein